MEHFNVNVNIRTDNKDNSSQKKEQSSSTDIKLNNPYGFSNPLDDESNMTPKQQKLFKMYEKSMNHRQQNLFTDLSAMTLEDKNYFYKELDIHVASLSELLWTPHETEEKYPQEGENMYEEADLLFYEK
ncbi:hypothetical protein M0802_001823 [Mischocyttarus mexicanus]|nr:hypothetical protein M0802_001823 [Mischocyttarus mexicanus]